MIGAGLKPAVKDHITVGFFLEPAVFWRALITAGLSQEPTVIGLSITVGSSQEPTVISLQHKKATTVLLSSILRTEARV